MARLQYLVLKTNAMRSVQDFYENIGFAVREEKHGQGPKHLAVLLDGDVVIEFYPGSASPAILGIYMEGAEENTSAIAGREVRGGVVTVVDPDGRTLRLHTEAQ